MNNSSLEGFSLVFSNTTTGQTYSIKEPLARDEPWLDEPWRKVCHRKEHKILYVDHCQKLSSIFILHFVLCLVTYNQWPTPWKMFSWASSLPQLQKWRCWTHSKNPPPTADSNLKKYDESSLLLSHCQMRSRERSTGMNCMRSRLLSICMEFRSPQLSILFSICNPHQVVAAFLEEAENEKKREAVFCMSSFC